MTRHPARFDDLTVEFQAEDLVKEAWAEKSDQAMEDVMIALSSVDMANRALRRIMKNG